MRLVRTNFQAPRYGLPIHPLPRRVIARGVAKQATLELRPLRLKVFRLVKAYLDHESTPHPYLTISAGETVSTLCSQLAAAVSPDGQTSSPYRIWSIPSDDSNQTEFLGSQLPVSDAKIIEESEQTLEEKELESDDAFVVEYKQPDGWIVEAPKAAPLAIEAPPPIFHSTDGFFNKMSSTRPSTSSMVPYKSALYNAFSVTSSSSRPSATAVTLPAYKAMDPGTLGLGNMSV